MSSSSLEATTRAHAKTHFPEAFEEAASWKISKINAREDGDVARCVLKLAGPGVVYSFKHEQSPINRSRFAKVFAQQQAAFQGFPKVAGMAVVEPVRVDAKRQCAIYKYVEGQTLRDHLTFFCPSRDLQLQMVERAGAWLDHLHRSGFDDTRRFNPNWVKHRYLDLRSDIEAGHVRMPEATLVTGIIDKIEQMTADLRGQDTVSALPHRDFHAGNLIWDGTTLTGIDLGGGNATPVGQDINKFLIDHVLRFSSVNELAAGQPYPADLKEAFFSGYKLVGPDDPTVRMFALTQLVDTWRTVPDEKLDRTEAKQQSLASLRSVAKHLVAQDGEKKSLRVMLTARSVTAERKREHAFLPILRKAARRRRFELSVREDSVGARKQAGRAEAFTMFHMAEPLDQRSLCFRKVYAHPFWQIAQTSRRWRWPVAKATFKDNPSAEADQFFDHWANRLHDIQNKTVRDDGYIYMPLQGRLLSHRSFQSMSPAEMIQTTLAQTDMPIRATLHPNETYRKAEIELLQEISKLNSRFTLVETPMQDALATCSYVVTENSSAGFHAFFYGKPVVLFAEVDFHHICLRVRDIGATAAFKKVANHRPDIASYLHWYWGNHAINIEDANAGAQLAKRMKKLGF